LKDAMIYTASLSQSWIRFYIILFFYNSFFRKRYISKFLWFLDNFLLKFKRNIRRISVNIRNCLTFLESNEFLSS
jgi:hypothetical protein